MPATRRVNCKRNNKQRGGGLGSVVNFAPPSFGHLVQNPLALSAGSSCLAEPRPGMIGSYSPHGLPGMSSFQKGGSRKNKKQNGGAYGFTGGSGIVGGFPAGATYTPVNSIGCTGSSSVPIPASGADGMLNKTGGQLWDGPHTSALQRGGAYESGAALGETLKTAGYSSLQPGANGVIHTGAGTLVSVNVPMDGRMAGGACGMAPQKGGRRNGSRKNRKDRKNRKGSRKNRNGSRKNRKGSRKNRKNKKN